MGYLRGDYYGGRGDYYQGDPGFFSSFFGGLARGVTKVASFLPGPLGVAGSLANRLLTPAKLPAEATPMSSAEATSMALATIPPAGALSATGMNPGTAALRPMVGPPLPGMALAGMPGMHVRRLHPNKSTYVTRGGGTSRWPVGLQIHPKGTEAVPTRRMNVANPRALRRALRRVAGFAKITKRVRGAVSMAASAVGVRHHRGKTPIRRK